jgi:hypothetical protein
MSQVWNRKSLETFNIYFPQSNTARDQVLVDNFAYFLNNVWRIPVAEHKTYAHTKSVMTARSYQKITAQPFQERCYFNTYMHIQFIPHRKHIRLTKTNWWTMFREIFALHCEKHKNPQTRLHKKKSLYFYA